MNLTGKRKIVITHALHTGDVVNKEISALGYPVKGSDRLHVESEGSVRDTIRLNLYLRTAHRVLFFIDAFHAASLNDLYISIKNIPWEDIIPVNGYFSIHSFVRQEMIRDFRIVNLKMKDAIVDRFQARFNKRPDSGNRQDHLVLFVRWVDDSCEIYLDTSGETLSRHGYRLHSWKAPLSESLAASIILATGWDPSMPLVNPMCGSGTLAIEGAMMASGRYPGLYRNNYGFLHLRESFIEDFKSLKKEIGDNVRDRPGTTILASDIHPGAIRQAGMNAANAGVEDLINFRTLDFRDIEMPEPPGIIMMNPEYGLRLGNTKNLESLYASIGDFFKQKCQGFTGYVFTGNADLAKHIGLRTRRKIPFLNGNIECRLLEYELYGGTKKNRND